MRERSGEMMINQRDQRGDDWDVLHRDGVGILCADGRF